MNKQITRMTLDVGLRDSYKVVFAKIGDTERRIIANVKDNGESYDLTSVKTVEVRCRKADGKQVIKNAVKESNNIIIDINGQMTTCRGTAIVDVVLYGTDGGMLSTAKFYLNVDDGAVNEDEIKSNSDYPNVASALRAVGLAKEVADTALSTANTALSTANTVLSTANTAEEKVEELLEKTVDFEKQGEQIEQIKSETSSLKEDIEKFPFFADIQIINGFYSYRNTGETFTESEEYCSKVTPIIACKPSQKFLYKGWAKWEIFSAMFYDQNRFFVSYLQVESEEKYTEITIPDNCYYVKFQSSKKNNTPVLSIRNTNTNEKIGIYELFEDIDQVRANIDQVRTNINQIRMNIDQIRADVDQNLLINLIDSSKIITGFAISNTYATPWEECLMENSEYASYAQLIPVYAGEKLYINRAYTGVCFFNAEKKFLVNSITSSDQTEVVVPENALYLSIYKKYTSNENFESWMVCPQFACEDTIARDGYKKWVYDAIKKLQKNEQLEGVTWCAFGDSLTDENTLKNENTGTYNYVNYVSASLGLVAINCGKGGTGYMADNSGYTPNFLNRIDTIPSKTELLTVFGSFNDYSKISEKLGSFGDTTEDTLYGCMYKFYDVLFEKFPDVIVGVITPTPWGYIHDSVIDAKSKQQADLYVKALLKTAEWFGIPILNLYTESGLRPWDATFSAKYYRDDNGNGIADTVHPLQNAHKRFIAPKVEAFIKQIYRV